MRQIQLLNVFLSIVLFAKMFVGSISSTSHTPLRRPKDKFQRCWCRYLACLGLYTLQETNRFVKPFTLSAPRIFLKKNEGDPDTPSSLWIEKESLDTRRIDNLEAFHRFLTWVDPTEEESKCDFAWEDPSRPPLDRLWKDVEKVLKATGSDGDFEKLWKVTHFKKELLAKIEKEECYVRNPPVLPRDERCREDGWMYDKPKHVVDLHGLRRGTAFSLATATLQFTRANRDNNVISIVGNPSPEKGERGHTVSTAVRDAAQMFGLTPTAVGGRFSFNANNTCIGKNERGKWVVGPGGAKSYFNPSSKDRPPD